MAKCSDSTIDREGDNLTVKSGNATSISEIDHSNHVDACSSEPDGKNIVSTATPNVHSNVREKKSSSNPDGFDKNCMAKEPRDPASGGPNLSASEPSTSTKKN